jgi:integrase/recombinase XerD
LQPDNGLWTREGLGLKASDVRLVAGTAKSVRVIGKGNQERLVPLPEAFGAVFGVWQRHPHSRRCEAVATLGRPESPRSGRHCGTVAFNDG